MVLFQLCPWKCYQRRRLVVSIIVTSFVAIIMAVFASKLIHFGGSMTYNHTRSPMSERRDDAYSWAMVNKTPIHGTGHKNTATAATTAHTVDRRVALALVNLGVNFSEYYQLLKIKGLESVELHDFKSPFIIDPDLLNDGRHKAPGNRRTKILSCYKCPKYFHSYEYNCRNCPYSECYYDFYGHNLSQAEVVFFGPNRIYTIPPRPTGQIWVYASWESPAYVNYPEPYSVYESAFNWTLSHRQDADVFAPYERLAWRDRDTLLSDSEIERIVRSKKRSVAWFVSHCKTTSKRMPYVRRMKKYIDVRVYGDCGPKWINMYDGYKRLNDTYKFYLSFENSFCKDYATEKFFRVIEQRVQVIPVVRGGFEYEKYLPPNTFINAANFTSPEELAFFLRRLGRDIPRYTQMLKEKDKLVGMGYRTDWCALCKQLHTGPKQKNIKNLKQEFASEACWNS